MLLEQMVEVSWNNSNKDWYTSKGYKFTKMRDVFLVKAQDLSPHSIKRVKIKCDNCGIIYETAYVDYMKKRSNEDLCKNCYKEKHKGYTIVECDYCKKQIKKKNSEVKIYNKHFCNAECRSKYFSGVNNQNFNSIPYKCDYCNKEIMIEQHVYQGLINGTRKNVFCSRDCKAKWQSENKKGKNHPTYSKIQKQCEYCRKTYEVRRSKAEKSKYCSPECSQLAQRKRIKFFCDTCGKECETTPFKYNSYKHHFCSYECSTKFDRKDRSKWIILNCEYCNKKYEVLKTIYEKQGSRFCSKKCRNKWESENKRGENHHNFNAELVSCDYCGNQIYRSQSHLNRQRYHFCNTDCRRKWYAEIWSQREEWKEECRIRSVKLLSEGVTKKTDTECQQIVNKMLDELNITYINEYNCKYVAIDNYLNEYNLMIEVMGTFWHTDPRFYDTIEYQMQLDQIKKDKIKRNYIKNNYKINILYLWEYDIINNFDMCKELILKYVNNHGVLKNYHSFNYSLIDGELVLDNNPIKPYFEQSIDSIRHLIKIRDTSAKRSKKQLDKWITFKCHYCGKEKEQLISHYKKAIYHFCSTECFRNFRKGKSLRELYRFVLNI